MHAHICDDMPDIGDLDIGRYLFLLHVQQRVGAYQVKSDQCLPVLVQHLGHLQHLCGYPRV